MESDKVLYARLPVHMHRQLRVRAADTGTTITQLVITALEAFFASERRPTAKNPRPTAKKARA